jgi:hypothetical protein
MFVNTKTMKTMSAAMKTGYWKLSFCAAALVSLLAVQALAQDLKPIMDLRGKWKLEVGDDPAWANPGYDDDDWTTVSVPSPWENQGFPGYDGYGWYRKWFFVPADWKAERLFLDLGYVDDVDETYLNGHFIGFQGEFPPTYVSRYGVGRRYAIPAYALKPGENNLIAVRVYDSQTAGGITHGDVRILKDRNVLSMVQSLERQWKFHTGDDVTWLEPSINERGWSGIQVPAYWETQGHKGYDGFGWYRLTFTLKAGLENERLILFMGKIDDYDEVYLNGQRVGRTGTFAADGSAEGSDNDYRQWRSYTLPMGALKKGTNVIAVRVFDKFYHGGIYEGPVGLTRRDWYQAWRSHQPRELQRWDFWGPLRWLEQLFQ